MSREINLPSFQEYYEGLMVMWSSSKEVYRRSCLATFSASKVALSKQGKKD